MFTQVEIHEIHEVHTEAPAKRTRMRYWPENWDHDHRCPMCLIGAGRIVDQRGLNRRLRCHSCGFAYSRIVADDDDNRWVRETWGPKATVP